MSEEKQPNDPTVYLTKPATKLQERFAIWIKEEVGYNPATAKTKDEAFLEGVRIATATRMVFQASDFNRAANAEAKAAREAEAGEPAEAPTPKPAKATKAAPAKAAPAKSTAAKATKAAPAKAAKAAAPAEAPKPARRPARRAPAASTATAEAPF